MSAAASLSPLELLEQRSRRLATRFNGDKSQKQTTPAAAVSPSPAPSPAHTPTPDQPQATNNNNTSSRFGRISRRASTASIASVASLGSILGSFRLSSLSIDSHDLTPTSSNVSTAPSVVIPADRPLAPVPAPQHSKHTLRRPASSQRISSTAVVIPLTSIALPSPASPPPVPTSPPPPIEPSYAQYYPQHSQHTTQPQTSPRPGPTLASSASHGSLHSFASDVTINNGSSNGTNLQQQQQPQQQKSPTLTMTSPRPSSSKHSPAFPPSSASSSSSSSSLQFHPRTANQRSFSGSSVVTSLSVSSQSSHGHSHSISSNNTISPQPAGHHQSLPSSSSMTFTHKRTASQQQQQQQHALSEFELLKEKRLENTLSLEDHVALGIYYHEEGNLRESSYHWQHAAFQGDVTAMLLYGLALRHGWGIRKNPENAVEWLQRAIRPILNEYSLEDVLQDQGSSKRLEQFLKNSDAAEGDKAASKGGKLKKTHVSLALYELGMCYLNAWGIDKDEDLALRCFELAGSLGDADALAEAARLWTHNGPKGTPHQRKKDFMRAAKLYRMAEKNGANVVANSWIYKDKYMDDDDDNPDKDKDKRKSILKKSKKK